MLQDNVEGIFVVTTEIDPEHEKIHQVIETERRVIFDKIMDLKETHIKEALIQLGWTPPNKGESDE